MMAIQARKKKKHRHHYQQQQDWSGSSPVAAEVGVLVVVLVVVGAVDYAFDTSFVVASSLVALIASFASWQLVVVAVVQIAVVVDLVIALVDVEQREL